MTDYKSRLRTELDPDMRNLMYFFFHETGSVVMQYREQWRSTYQLNLRRSAELAAPLYKGDH